MQCRIPNTEHGAGKRFTRRIVKKQAFQESNIKVVHIQQNGYMPIVRKAMGGGGGGPEPEPFCGAGGGPEWLTRRGAGCSLTMMDSEEEELMYARANRRQQSPLEALRSLKVRALVTLDAARALASDAFMKAASAKNGNDYNRYMDESAVAGVEVQRLYSIVDNIEDRIMFQELTF